ncbi:type II toxin-antitoxin system Phd/YefM family antitoxin [bacterium]|nr:type II toxin-antitoxin system Phd/YefM family antitoxin [bacterium]
MLIFSATEAKNRFGELLEASHSSPVEIDKQGRPVAVLLSYEAYQELRESSSGLRSDSSLNWLRDWRDSAEKSRCKNPTGEDDYLKHLDEKYGQ